VNAAALSLRTAWDLSGCQEAHILSKRVTNYVYLLAAVAIVATHCCHCGYVRVIGLEGRMEDDAEQWRLVALSDVPLPTIVRGTT
jgi:hypothetical protein